MNIEYYNHQLNNCLSYWNTNIQNTDKTIKTSTIDLALNNIFNSSEKFIKCISRLNKVDDNKEIISQLKLKLKQIKSDLKNIDKTDSQIIKTVTEKKIFHKNLVKFNLKISNLESKIADLEQHKMSVDHFTVPSSFKEQLAIGFRNGIDFIFDKIKSSLSPHIFAGHKGSYKIILNTKLKELIKKDQILEKKITAYQKHLEAKLNMLNEKAEKIQDKITEEGANLSEEKLGQLNAEKDKILVEVKELKNKLKSLNEKANLDKISRQHLAKAFQRVKIDDSGLLPEKVLSDTELEQMYTQIREGFIEIAKVNTKITKLDDGVILSQKARQDLHSIGGEAVKIKLEKENVTLDGMYISVEKFKQSLDRAGGQIYSLEITPKPGETIKFSGISFPKEGFDLSSVKIHLENVGLFPKGEKAGAGWVQVEYEGQILFMGPEEAQQFALEQKTVERENIKLSTSSEMTFKLDSERATAIITTGDAGVYEMHKREMMSFLLKGINVMAFNFRGYGESTGVPSSAGLKKDMEAVYQYVKDKNNVPDNKILLKALCMSGGPATYLAAKHPDINLLLDQSYANFTIVIKDKVKVYIDEYIKEKFSNSPIKEKIAKSLAKWLTTPVIKTLISLSLLPDWNTQLEIRKIRGNVGILFAESDTLMTLDRDVYQNYKALLESRKAKNVSIASIPGEHASSWVDAPKGITLASEDEAKLLEFHFKNKFPGFKSKKPAYVQALKPAYMLAQEYGLDSLHIHAFWNKVAGGLEDLSAPKEIIAAKAQEILDTDPMYTKLSPQNKEIYLKFVIETPFEDTLTSAFMYIKNVLENQETLDKEGALRLIKTTLEQNYGEEFYPLIKPFFDRLIAVPGSYNLSYSSEAQTLEKALIKTHPELAIPLSSTFVAIDETQKFIVSKLEELEKKHLEELEEPLDLEAIKKLKNDFAIAADLVPENGIKLFKFWQAAIEKLNTSHLPHTEENINKVAVALLTLEEYGELRPEDRTIYLQFLKNVPQQTLGSLFKILQKKLNDSDDKTLEYVQTTIHQLVQDYPLGNRQQAEQFLLKLANINPTNTYVGQNYVNTFLKKANLSKPLI